MSISRIATLSLAGAMLASGAAAETLKVATWNIENLTVGSRTAAELAALRELVDLLDADVIALQEVDGPQAAQQIFDDGEYTFHFSTHRTTRSSPASPSGKALPSRQILTWPSWTSAMSAVVLT